MKIVEREQERVECGELQLQENENYNMKIKDKE